MHGWWLRIAAWTACLGVAKALILGYLGWCITMSGWLAVYATAEGEPYFDWETVVHGILEGLVLSGIFSAAVSTPVFVLSGVIVAVCRMRDRRHGQTPRDFAPARAWLLAPWLLMPLTLLVSFCGMITAGIDQIHTGSPSDPAYPFAVPPPWATSICIASLGSHEGLLAMPVTVLFIACLCVSRSRVTAEHAPVCGRCGYNLRGIASATICPECGRDWLSPAANLQRAPSDSAWIFRHRDWLWCIVESLAAVVIVMGAHRLTLWLTQSIDDRPVEELRVIFTAFMMAAAFGAAWSKREKRRRLVMLTYRLAIAALLGMAWLIVTQFATFSAILLLPNSSPGAQPWWFFGVLNESFLMPSLLLGAITWWIVRDMPRWMPTRHDPRPGA
jgi:hypothetical protein